MGEIMTMQIDILFNKWSADCMNNLYNYAQYYIYT